MHLKGNLFDVSDFLIIAGTLAVGCAGGMAELNTRSTNRPVGTTVSYETITEQVMTAASPVGEMTTATTEFMSISVTGPVLGHGAGDSGRLVHHYYHQTEATVCGNPKTYGSC